MNRRQFLAAARMTLAAAVLSRAGARARAAELFDASTLHDVRLFIHSRDLQELRARYEENIYFPADLHWGGLRLRNVAVRSRGTGSRNPVKLGLRVDIDRYTSGQQLTGLHALVLDNLWQDPALVREQLAMAFFARLGQAAPREAFCRLTINGREQGLYALVEEIDETFVQRAIEQPAGHLYEYKYTQPFFGEYLGEAFEPYARLFEPRTQEHEPVAALYAPIQDLFRDVNADLDPDSWRTAVDRSVDLPQFLTQVAIEAFLAENDGLLGYAGMNNFYLYRYAGTSRHRFLPWDKDFAFTFLDSPLPATDDNVLFRRAMGFPDLKTLFLDAVEACAAAATDGDWLREEVERAVAVVSEAARADALKQYANDDFDAGVEFLRTFARVRPGLVLDQVAAARRA